MQAFTSARRNVNFDSCKANPNETPVKSAINIFLDHERRYNFSVVIFPDPVQQSFHYENERKVTKSTKLFC